MSSSRLLSQEEQKHLDDLHKDTDDSDSDDDELLLSLDHRRFTFSQHSVASSRVSLEESSSQEPRPHHQQHEKQPHSSNTSPSSTTLDDDHHHHDTNAISATTTTTNQGANDDTTTTTTSQGGVRREEEEVMMQADEESELNRRAAKKAMYASMDQVKSVHDVSKLCWHVIKKTKYYPCVIRDDNHEHQHQQQNQKSNNNSSAASAFAKDLKVQWNQQKPILIEYLGFRDKVSTGKLAAASKSSLLPYDYNNKTNKAGSRNVNDDESSSTAMPTAAVTSATTNSNAPTAAATAIATVEVAEWSPTIMASYEKILKSLPSFAAGEDNVHVKARAEVMALNRMLQTVVQRQQQQQGVGSDETAAAAFALTQQQPSEDDEEDDDEDDESLQDDHEMIPSNTAVEPPQQQQADSSSSTNVAATADVAALSAGDVITYFAPGLTACLANRRTSQIVAVYPRGDGGGGIVLYLEDGAALVDEKVLLVKRFLRKRLVKVQGPKWRLISDCTLSSKKNGQFVQAQHQALYGASNQLKALQQDLQQEQDAFWQQQRGTKSSVAESSKSITAPPTATTKSVPALAAPKKDAGDCDHKNNDNAPLKQAKQGPSKKKSAKQENAGHDTDVTIVPTAAAPGGKKRQRRPGVSTGDISGNQSKRKHKASDQDGTAFSTKEEKKVTTTDDTKLPTDKADKTKQPQKKKGPVSWKGKLQAHLEAVRAQRNKSRYNRELVQAQEDNLTTALAVLAHLESSASSSTTTTTTTTTTTIDSRRFILDQDVMDEIADDCDVPTDRLVDYLHGNERNLINQSNVERLTESLKRWLQKESQKDDGPLQPPPDKPAPLHGGESCPVSNVAQSSTLVLTAQRAVPPSQR